MTSIIFIKTLRINISSISLIEWSAVKGEIIIGESFYEIEDLR